MIAVDLHVRGTQGERFDGTVALVWDEDLPLYAHLVFDGPDVDGEHVVWSFLRDLIADGVDGPAGMGDVQFYPHLSGRICLTLSAPEGELTLMCLRRELVDFVEDTYFRVPRGAEQVDVDVDAELFLLIQREGSL